MRSRRREITLGGVRCARAKPASGRVRGCPAIGRRSTGVRFGERDGGDGERRRRALRRGVSKSGHRGASRERRVRDEDEAFAIAVAGVAALYIFVRSTVTGPRTEKATATPFVDDAAKETSDAWDATRSRAVVFGR